MRYGGNWKRGYGTSYTGTQGETLDTAKELPTDCCASSRPYHHFGRRLAPRLQRGDIVALDNLPAHKAPEVKFFI